MQVYISPEFMNQESQVLNVIDQNGNAVGYLAFIFDEKTMYVYGWLENEGMEEDFKDLIQPYIQGMGKTQPGLSVYSSLAVGGKKLEIGQTEQETSK